jgi:hypothetical protein
MIPDKKVSWYPMMSRNNNTNNNNIHIQTTTKYSTTKNPQHWTAPGDIVPLISNGNLEYVGHLKTQ